MKAILLSPHSDDACFSLGVFAKETKHVCVINIFTTSGYLPGMHGLDQSEATCRVTAIRRSEDDEFAEAASLERLDCLGLLDAPLRGLAPLSAEPSEEELAYVASALSGTLAELWCEFGQGTLLLAPAGIGEHVDHLTIRDWLIENFVDLSSKYSLGFYEDLHYASDPQQRRRGIEELLSRVPNSHACIRVRIPIDQNGHAKLKLLRIYKSQFPSGHIDMKDFIPAENDKKLPHEAFWIVCPKDHNPNTIS